MSLRMCYSVLSLLVLVSFPTAGQTGPIRVACIGNSITEGSGLGDQTYPAQLGRMLGEQYEVRNFGLGGTTMLRNGDRPYWTQPIFYAVQDFDPHIAIVSLGTNDSKPWNWDGHKGEFYGDYMDFVAVLREGQKHPQIFVCLPPPAFVDAFGITNAVIRDEINPLIDSVRLTARTLSIDLYHLLAGDTALYADGIHPNAAGDTHIAEIVRDAILNSPAGFARYLYTASPTFEQGDQVKLYWETTAGSEVTINGEAVSGTDSMVVNPAGTTTYILIARGPEFSDTIGLTLQYIPPGKVKSFSVEPELLDLGWGDTCEVRWMASKGSAVTLDGLPVGLDSSMRIVPPATTTFTLVARGDTTDSAAVTVLLLPPEEINRAYRRPVTAYSTERGFSAGAVCDGDTATYWKEPAVSAQHYIYVDLGRTISVNRVVFHWGAVYAVKYSVQALDSAYRASSLFNQTAGDGGLDDLTGLNKNARYVRVVFTGKSQPDSGYVLREFEVYGTRLSSLDVEEPGVIPARFMLGQNYPNPFNPRTVVSSQYPVASWVRLAVYDLLGREVAVLVNERRAGGTYHDVMDGTGLASGVYIYRLTAGSFVMSRTMVLLR